MIIAYASGNSDPSNNPDVDPSVDLSATSLPTTVTVYGAAEDTTDSLATFSWQWTLLDPTSSASIVDSTLQDIEVNVTAWHNVRVHLVATNTTTGETSETNILIAPSSSFCEIRVLSVERGLQKPAKGARDWHTALGIWADKLEDSVDSTTVVLRDLSDVATATGAALDELVDGSSTTLHEHPGSQVAPATSSTQGTVVLEPIGNNLPVTTVPKVLFEERLVYSQSADQSVDPSAAGAYSNKIIVHSPAAAFHPHVVFCAYEEIELREVSITMLDSGAQPTQYEFDICFGNTTALATFAMQKQGLSLTGTAGAAYMPMVIEHTLSTAITISAGDYFGIVVKQSPAEADAGRGLRVTFRAVRVLN
jgi:hypothetical protein